MTIASGKGQGRDFVFDKEVVKIGRQPDNDLVLYHTGVSRYHCEIVRDGDEFRIRDAGSANGTMLNDEVTEEAPIHEGDRIGVGPITFVFRAPESQPAKGRRKVIRPQVVDRPKAQKKRRELEAMRTHAVDLDELERLDELEKDRDNTPPSGTHRIKQLRPKAAKPAVVVARSNDGGGGRVGLRARWRNLPSSTRRVSLIAVGTLLAAGTVSALLVGGSPPKDRSKEIFELNDRTRDLVFGGGKVGVSTPDLVNFSFEYQGGRAVLKYGAAGVDTPTELAILVNDKPAGYVEVCHNWTRDLSFVLPRNLLQPGTNKITFDNTYTPKRTETWLVSQVVLVHEPLPPADPVKAQELYKLGNDAFKTRSVSPANLYRAITYFEQALTFLEALEEPPQLHGAITFDLQRAEEKLQAIHDNHIFSAEKSVRFGDYEQAAATLSELIKYYPDENDRRHKDIKRKINRLRSNR